MTFMIPARGRLTVREVVSGKVIGIAESVTLTIQSPECEPVPTGSPEKITAIAVQLTATAVTEGVNVPCNPQAS